MMINYITGNILDSKAQALVNTVNTVGVMGKGIALQFKIAYPNNYKSYLAACKRKELVVGKMFVTTDNNISSGEKQIINFPTKQNWRKPSEYIYIEDGLDDLINVIEQNQISSIAIPPIGAGNGGLKWEKVKKIIEEKLNHLDIEIFVYEPTTQIKEKLKKERVKLTNARALLLYVLYDLVNNGEFISEFSSEKISYFLQRFGASEYFKLQFSPKFYGPYSGKVRYLLNALNGSYIMGYSDMDKKPFEPLTIVADGLHDVKNHIENNPELYTIAKNTTTFLNGFYSDFALELLSSIDYIVSSEKSFDKLIISQKLKDWSGRKQSMFSNPKYIDISIKHLQNAKINFRHLNNLKLN
jgi:O-acetyl-ADP-ribose deacetylase (regulator of RNase III)